MTLALPLEAIGTAALISARVGGLVMGIPALGGESIPTRIKGALIIILTLVMMFALRPAASDIDFVPSLMAELAIGAMMGLVVRIAFGAAELAGEVVAQQIGFGLEASFNPMSDAETGVYAQLFSAAVGLVFFACDGHLEVIRALAASIVRVPPGSGALALITPDVVVRAMAETTMRGLMLAAPLSVAVLAGQMVLGVIARVAPQMNPWSFGFMITSSVALIGASMAAPAIVHQLAGIVHESFADLSVWLAG